MVFINEKDKEKSFENLKELFGCERNERSGYFGSYLGEKGKEPIPSVLLSKVNDRIATYGRYLSNLETLRGEVSRLAADEESKRLQGTVNDMSDEQAKALMNQLKLKLGL